MAPIPNPKAGLGSGEFANFHSRWSKTECFVCRKVGHIGEVCPENARRKKFDENLLREKQLTREAELGCAMFANTQHMTVGMKDIHKEEFMRVLMSKDVREDEMATMVGMLAREEVDAQSWLAGVPRLVPPGPVITIDSGCSTTMVGRTWVVDQVKRGTPMDFLRCEKPHNVETGKGIVTLELAIRVMLRLPVWCEDGRGRPMRLGHMPLSITAVVNPYLPIEMLWGNSMALEYMCLWQPWNGRYWLDCPMLENKRVWVQLAYTQHLSVVAPLITYEDSVAGAMLMEEEYLGRGSLDHLFSFPFFHKAQWSAEAHRLRYDPTRVPLLSGSYPATPGMRAKQDGYSFAANGKSDAYLWKVPSEKRMAKPKRTGYGSVGVSLSNAFQALARVEEEGSSNDDW